MTSAKHIPLVILCLILASALVVLVLGFRFAKEEKEIAIELDRAPLSNFSARLHNEIGDLNSLYESHLYGIRNRLSPDSSSIEITAVCRNIVGIEQATIFHTGRPPVHLDLRETDRSDPLPLPRESDDNSDGGIIVNVTDVRNADSKNNFLWITQDGHPPHFAATLNYKTTLVLRINSSQMATEMNDALAEWLPDAFTPIKAAGIPTTLQNPAGDIAISTGNPDLSAAPDLLLPVPSLFGEWKIFAWQETEKVISYSQPVMVGSATLAVVLVIAGIFGFNQQQRAIRLAGQRVSFVNQVSHELRTPMTNIMLNIDLLSDSLSEENSTQINRLNLIREEASRLSRLLENVLTFSRREKSKSSDDEPQQTLRTVPCEVNRIIQSVLSQFSPTLARKNLHAQHTPSDSAIFVFADPDAFSQIISNLISNVEKYAADGGKFEITIKSSPSDDTVAISITDFGSGIPESEAARIFQPFVRLSDATTEGVSGTGLGLAIARDLAESMSGKLVMESGNAANHEGCRFVLTLPLSAENIVSMAS